MGSKSKAKAKAKASRSKAKAKPVAKAKARPPARDDQPYDVDDYLPGGLGEEMDVMAERAQPPRVFNSDTLRAPLKTMPFHTPVTVSPGTTIAEAIEKMQRGHFGCVLVIERGKPVGIFTERDVLFKLAMKGKDWNKVKIAEYMTPDPDCLPVDASIAFALNMMTEGGYRHIPIVDGDGKAISVLSIRDVTRYIAGFFEKEIKNLPPRPQLLHPTKHEQGGG